MKYFLLSQISGETASLKHNHPKLKCLSGFVVIYLIILLLSGETFAQLSGNMEQKRITSETPAELKGPYLGQKPPGMEPELFAPGIISTNITEWTLTFMPDGLEAYYTIQGLNNINHLICIKSINGKWQKPEIASFANPDHNADPFISPDGKKLFFWSNRPENPGQEPGDNSDIWFVERKGNEWGKPVKLDSTINTKHWQIFPTVAMNGNLYFSCNYPDSKGGFDIYKSELINGKYTKPVNLGDSINSINLEQEPYISPDESYIIFCSDRHAPKSGNWDLYISFKKKDGTWTKAKNMGNAINSNAMDQAPIVTSDGKYLFFSSKRIPKSEAKSKDFSYESIIESLNKPGNGNSDVYWIDAKVIDYLKMDM
jgi:Tol biopolymer transport system component